MPVGGEDDVGDEVPVSVQPLLRDPVAHLVPGQLPDDERLVPGGRQDHVGVLWVGGDLGDPSVVAHEGPTKLQRLSHDAGGVEGRARVRAGEGEGDHRCEIDATFRKKERGRRLGMTPRLRRARKEWMNSSSPV